MTFIAKVIIFFFTTAKRLWMFRGLDLFNTPNAVAEGQTPQIHAQFLAGIGKKHYLCN